MTQKIVVLSFFTSLGLLITSCDNKTKESEKKDELTENTVVADSAKKTTAAANDDVSYTLPSPMQIASIFKKSGLKYYSGLTNKVDNSNTYNASSSTLKALNLGIYSADLSYCILNKQNQECKNYLKACRQLASQLGFAQAFENNNMLARFEKNINNEDSLSKMLVSIEMQTDEMLEESNQTYISTISFAGAWVESMFIGVQVHGKEKNANMATKLVEQMGIADNLIKALKASADKQPELNSVIDDMTAINEIYNSFKSIRQQKAADVDAIDPAKVDVSLEELLVFCKKVEEIRAKFVKG